MSNSATEQTPPGPVRTALRYRLHRIAQRTGRDPHRFSDLIELVSAARVLDAAHQP